MPSLRVFLSYSHDSPAHAQRVLALADQLRRDGVDAWIDQYDEHQSSWTRWMVDEIARADRVLAVCTATYRRRFEGHETEGGRGVDFEGAILTGDLYRRRRDKVIPVVFGDDEEVVPTVLRDATRYDLDAPDGYERLYRELTRQPAVEAPALGRVRRLPSLDPRRRVSTFGLVSVQMSTPEPEDSAEIEAYRSWAREHYAYLDLIGLGAGDLRVGLDEIYVPLRIGTDRGARAGALPGEDPGRRGFAGPETVELDRLFLQGAALDDASRHALVFGEPGSGKTTALRKLHQLTFDPGAEALGLAPGTLPVFLRLRRFSKERLDGSLTDFVEAEIQEISGGRVPEGAGEALWRRGRLLLLLDGLDEIADEEHRAKVLERLAWCLGEADAADVRAVVSTRPAGWTSAVRAVRLDGFLRADVRPFDDEQIRSLVELWFREVVRLDQLPDALANERAGTLVQALYEERNQQIQVLVSTPMLLTLLCVVVMRGGEIPRRRVDFYEECLKVLLGRWRQHQARRKAPVDPEQALLLAGELAWYLHSRNRRDDLVFVQGVRVLFGPVGDRETAIQLFHWFHRDAGILDRYTEKHFGFTHLGLQEHLTSRHLASHPDLLDDLDGEWWDDSWWEEVAQLLAALPGGRGFVPLMDHLLATDAVHRRADLLSACLRDAAAVDWGPFRRALEAGDDARCVAILRLLRNAVTSDRPMSAGLLERIETLSETGLGAVRGSAKALLAMSERDAAPGSAVFLLHGPEDAPPAARIASHLEQRSLSTDRPGDRSWEDDHCATRMLESSVVVVLAGRSSLDHEVLEDTLFLCPEVLVVLLPGESRPTSPIEGYEVIDLSSFEGAAFESLVDRLHGDGVESASVGGTRGAFSLSVEEAPSSDTAVVAGENFHEPITDETFLWVPGGRFEMGDQVWVRLSPYRLARTPVTNRQYALFLKADRQAKEPHFWRERRFSDPSQPVVGVSWHDATAYCQWLTETSNNGQVFQLPSEAQWEFAARGASGREYPWGDEEPNDSLACFGLDRGTGKPSSVGRYAAGMGPFGHLDLAGNVLEWCVDHWEPSFELWLEDEPLDPVGTADDSRRPVRGGCWLLPSKGLRSASRGRLQPGIHNIDVGFRVLCVPASVSE